MCRLLAHASPRPITDAEIVGDVACATFQDMSRFHGDGWGTTWIDPNDSSLRMHRVPTTGAGSKDLAATLAAEPSAARITHLRWATVGLVNTVENTHPFQVGDIALAHNGNVQPVDELRAMVTPEEIARVGGTTDSAIVFALILRRIEAGVAILDAAVAVAAELRSRFPVCTLNLMLLTPHELVVLHATEGFGLHVDDIVAAGLDPAEAPVDHEGEMYYRIAYRQDERGVVFASTGLDREGWSLMPHGTAMRVALDTLEVTHATLPTASVAV